MTCVKWSMCSLENRSEHAKSMRNHSLETHTHGERSIPASLILMLVNSFLVTNTHTYMIVKCKTGNLTFDKDVINFCMFRAANLTLDTFKFSF